MLRDILIRSGQALDALFAQLIIGLGALLRIALE